MTKLEQIQAEIDSKNQLIEQESKNGQQTNHDQIIQWRSEIATLTAQLDEAKAEEANQQRQTAQIGGLKETLRSIFEAAFPKDETVKLIGLTEYETTQQTFNALVDQAVDEDQTGLYAAFNEQLTGKDEKIRQLNLQGLDTENKLTAANGDIEHLSQTAKDNEEEIAKLKQEIANHPAELAELNAEIERLKSHVSDLQVQLANAPAPRNAIEIGVTTASVSLSEQIAQAKENSKKQLAGLVPVGNLYSEAKFTDGTSQLVHNSEIPSLQVSPLPGIADAATVLPPELPNVGTDFRPQEVQSTTAGLDGNATAPEVVGQTESQVEDFVTVSVYNTGFKIIFEHINALEAKVTELESAKAAA